MIRLERVRMKTSDRIPPFSKQSPILPTLLFYGKKFEFWESSTTPFPQSLILKRVGSNYGISKLASH